MAVWRDAKHFLRCAALLCAELLAPISASAAVVPAFESGETVEATAVQAGGVVPLADGRSIALVGVALPHSGQPLAEKARTVLETLLVGRAIELRYAAVIATGMAGCWHKSSPASAGGRAAAARSRRRREHRGQAYRRCRDAGT